MGQSGRALKASKDGNGAADVKRQVDSDVNNQRPIYQLVDVKSGGGKLIELIKSKPKQWASSSSSTSFGLSKSAEGGEELNLDANSVDQQIRNLVEPLLYNKGRGKLIALSELWRIRLGRTEASEVDEKLGDEEEGDEDNYLDETCRRRLVCWKLSERGFVGETALHICFLLSSQSHMILAQKLLALFPALINDIYTCDEYFGESSLHMAIVNENVRIVRLLLDHGACVHERCLGSFFLPEDQKDKANNLIRRSFDRSKANRFKAEQQQQQNNKGEVDKKKKINQLFFDRKELEQVDLQSNYLPVSSNYDGYVYWGEYPLSFAVSLGLVDCYKLLLAKGANPNSQDSNGNATLHFAVIANRIQMFDLSYSDGANLSLRNRQNLTPLALAVKLRRVEMFFHILTIQRQVNWLFCNNIGFVETPLIGIESVNMIDGTCDQSSALSIVVSGVSIEQLAADNK